MVVEGGQLVAQKARRCLRRAVSCESGSKASQEVFVIRKQYHNVDGGQQAASRHSLKPYLARVSPAFVT